MKDGVEVSEDDAPLDLLKICGKKVYFLQANSILITKLKKQNKKFQEREDFTIMHLHDNKEEYVIYLNEKILENLMFWNVSIFSQNIINTTGLFQKASFFSYILFVFYS